MEQQLRSCLLEGETIRWMGRPSPFCLSRLPFRRSFYLTWLAFAGCSAAAALLLFPPLLDGRRSLFSTVVILAAVLAVPALFSLQPFSDKYKLERHTLYAITNLRALTMVDGHVLSLPLRYMHTPVEVVDLRDAEACAALLAAWLEDYGTEEEENA